MAWSNDIHEPRTSNRIDVGVGIGPIPYYWVGTCLTVWMWNDWQSRACIYDATLKIFFYLNRVLTIVMAIEH